MRRRRYEEHVDYRYSCLVLAPQPVLHPQSSHGHTAYLDQKHNQGFPGQVRSIWCVQAVQVVEVADVAEVGDNSRPLESNPPSLPHLHTSSSSLSGVITIIFPTLTFPCPSFHPGARSAWNLVPRLLKRRRTPSRVVAFLT
jgi:hypothetical protein